MTGRSKLRQVREKGAATSDKYLGVSSTGIIYKSREGHGNSNQDSSNLSAINGDLSQHILALFLSSVVVVLVVILWCSHWRTNTQGHLQKEI
jgi:hypothetical protein